ncbi:MNIO family bufferin maturase [Pseudomonas sp. AM4(2022)]|uniref:MNIO family bufferin maturase n=1 Tax=Pseudomonas sp. AM4(2022) TaxID=2983408 RepID=UPI002E802FD6|nr:DUF692 domain-containing protein [Pseudomonas sp. AM4(2022)]
MMTLTAQLAVAPAQAPGLPYRAGLGLKTEHFTEVLETRPDIGFFEIHAENYMVAGGPFHHYLGLIRAQYPLSLHGVGLSIGGEGPLDREHLARLATLIERYQPQSFSEHLAWSSHGPVFLNDLLPLAYDASTLERVCEHIDQVQSTLKRPMLLENPSTYLQFQRSTLDETDFISEIVRRTGCGLLLDVNNVYVSCINHQRDPLAYIDALPLHAVGEIHLAGFAEDTDNLGDRLLIDDHGAPIDNAVWQLYAQVLARTGAVATLIERDNQVPAFSVLQAEARQAQWYLSQVAR